MKNGNKTSKNSRQIKKSRDAYSIEYVSLERLEELFVVEKIKFNNLLDKGFRNIFHMFLYQKK